MVSHDLETTQRRHSIMVCLLKTTWFDTTWSSQEIVPKKTILISCTYYQLVRRRRPYVFAPIRLLGNLSLFRTTACRKGLSLHTEANSGHKLLLSLWPLQAELSAAHTSRSEPGKSLCMLSGGESLSSSLRYQKP